MGYVTDAEIIDAEVRMNAAQNSYSMALARRDALEEIYKNTEDGDGAIGVRFDFAQGNYADSVVEVREAWEIMDAAQREYQGLRERRRAESEQLRV
jgi:uncharacterized protein YbjQ (UPF0145 family)